MRLPELELVTPPARYPVSLAEVRNHLRIADDHTIDDAWLDAALSAATEQAQYRTGRQLITATWNAYFDDFPRCWNDFGEWAFDIPRPKLQAVESITYLDDDGVEQTLATDIYRVVTFSTLGRVALAFNKSWPRGRSQPGCVVIRFQAGYGDDMGSVPEPIRQWIKINVSTLYENRSMINEGSIVSELKYVPGLLDPYDVRFPF